MAERVHISAFAAESSIVVIAATLTGDGLQEIFPCLARASILASRKRGRNDVEFWTLPPVSADEKCPQLVRDYINFDAEPYASTIAAFCYVFKDEDTADVHSLYTNPRFQGCSFGTKAMILALKVAKTRFGLDIVVLDDATAVDPPSNIYFRLGFQIAVSTESGDAWVPWTLENATDWGGPERRALIDDVIERGDAIIATSDTKNAAKCFPPIDVGGVGAARFTKRKRGL